MSTDSPTTHRQNLTRERRQLRALRNQCDTQRPQQIAYRGITLRREPDTESQAYELVDDGESLGSIELDTFHNADDFVRFVDAAIKDDFATAMEYVRNELTWGLDDYKEADA